MSNDYENVTSLYKQGIFGGQFDEDRDSESRMSRQVEINPNSILVCETNGKIVGTVTLIFDKRTAWLFRFAVLEGENDAYKVLYDEAVKILKQNGHSQVLVYAPAGHTGLLEKYSNLGFSKGGEYTCFHRKI